MTMQAEEIVEAPERPVEAPERQAPERLGERVSRLEGAYEQGGERLRDLQSSVDSLRLEVKVEMKAQRDEANANFAAQRAATEALRVETDRKFEAQAAQITALGDSIRAEMKAQRDETNEQMKAQAAATEALRLEVAAQTTAQRDEANVNFAAQRDEANANFAAQRAEMNTRFAEHNNRLDKLTIALVTVAVAQIAALAAIIIQGL